MLHHQLQLLFRKIYYKRKIVLSPREYCLSSGFLAVQNDFALAIFPAMSLYFPGLVPAMALPPLSTALWGKYTFYLQHILFSELYIVYLLLYLCCPSKASLRYSAIPSGDLPRDWQRFPWAGGAERGAGSEPRATIEPPLLAIHLASLSHFSSFKPSLLHNYPSSLRHFSSLTLIRVASWPPKLWTGIT